MKILYVIPSLACAGAEILLGDIARSVSGKGHDVRIVQLQQFHPSWKDYPEKDALLKEVPLTIIESSVQFRLFRPTTLKTGEFERFLSDFEPEVIHSHLYLSELVTRAAVRKNAAYFSHGHDNMPQLRKFSARTLLDKKLLTNFWERNWLLKRYKQSNTQFIAISRDVEKYLKCNLPGFENAVHYLPNAVRTDRFNCERSYEHPANKPFHMVSIASLVPKKNHIFLLDVMKILLEKGYNVTLDVLGDGVLRPMLEQKVKERGLEGRLVFRGSVGSIPQRLWEAQLYVHPAWYEPFGLVLLEAMATGLPVVSLDGQGNRELVLENQNGFMLPANAGPDEFAAKIARLIDTPSERERMGTFARSFAERYDINAYTDKLLEIYRKSLSELGKG